MQYSLITYGHHAIYYISRAYLFYNQNFVPFDHLPTPLPTLVTINLFIISISLFICFCLFLHSTYEITYGLNTSAWRHCLGLRSLSQNKS